MSTPNFKTQKHFDLYASEMTISMLDEDGNETDEYEFDEGLFRFVNDNVLSKLNDNLRYFEITFKDGYYNGVQTYVQPLMLFCRCDTYLDFINYYDEYDGKEIYAEFGFNKYVLKQKILKEIKYINETLLPQLKDWTFEQIRCVGVFSNGEAVYEIV